MNEEQLIKMIQFLDPVPKSYCKTCIEVFKPDTAVRFVEAFLEIKANRIIASG